MTKYLQKCKNCNQYGLANDASKCRHCGGPLLNVKPPKFSLIDKYAQYRIQYFKEKYDPQFNTN